MRYHVHCSLTADDLAERNAVMTLSIDAADDAEAQAVVFETFPDLEMDIVELEEADD